MVEKMKSKRASATAVAGKRAGAMAGIGDAVRVIKEEILRSRYRAARLANVELLMLYFRVGAYISANSRKGKWGTGAINSISNRLQQELPGLRGFSATNMKSMRLFFEAWFGKIVTSANRQLPTADLLTLPVIRQLPTAELAKDDAQAFFAVGFTHHREIHAKCKSSDERWYYIREASSRFWTVEVLRSHINSGDWKRRGRSVNNFSVALADQEMAARAVRAFKDEYFLGGINPGGDPDYIDEHLLETAIVADIKKFIMALGDDFCFMGEQFRVIVEDEEQFIDLLFYNRDMKCLVAIELKAGKFRPSYLGQLNFYLSALDEKVRRPDENPSVGLVLCEEANRRFVELAIRDVRKPIGVATYKTDRSVPPAYRRLVPLMNGVNEILEGR